MEGEGRVLRSYYLDHLLNDSRAVHIQCDRYQRRRRSIHQRDPLLDRSVLDQLLYQIVAKRVHRKRHDIDANRLEDEIDVRLHTQVQLILKESAAILLMSQLQQPA